MEGGGTDWPFWPPIRCSTMCPSIEPSRAIRLLILPFGIAPIWEYQVGWTLSLAFP